MARGKVFISAVTSEFDAVRAAIAANLRAKGWEVKEQTDFRREVGAHTLLKLLHDYIKGCDRVVCVLGKRSGGVPKPAEVADFRYPPILPEDVAEASYTQWEYFIARHYRRDISVYIADDNFKPEKDKGDDIVGLQTAYVEYLKKLAPPYKKFATADALRADVLTEDWEGKPVRTAAVSPPGKPIVLPYPSIGDLFKGRDDFLKRLRDSLSRRGGNGQTAIFNSSALYGMGGIGKTRAAVEYAHHHRGDYCTLLFVVGDTPETLRRNLADLSKVLFPDIDPAAPEPARLNAVFGWLNGNAGWLLILDNLDSVEALAEADQLMSNCAGGHVIITSRRSNFAGQIEPLELDLLTEDEAHAFLLQRTQGRRRKATDDDARARELARELGRLALALEQAAAFIAKDRLTFAQYLDLWRSNQAKVMEWSDEAVTHYPRAVAVTWQTSVDQLTPAGRRLLERLAWLSPEQIPDFLLDVPCPGEDENLRDALADLAAFSLVTRDADGPFFLIHRLVQDVTRRSLDEKTRARSLGEALEWINGAFAGDSRDVRTWPILEPLASHALAVSGHAEAAGFSDPTAELLNQIAGLFFGKALHAEAERLVRRALDIDEKRLGPNHNTVATRVNNLAQLLRATNRLAEAEPLMRRALDIGEKNLGPDHPNVATRLNNLALLMQDTGRLTEAEPLMRRALDIGEKNLGPDHPNVATRLDNLAALLQDTDRLTEAEPLTRRALAIDEKAFGLDHPSVAVRLNNLAQLLRATNRFAEAEPLMRRALAIDEKALGPDHPDVAIDLNNLAGLLQVTGRLDEAEPLARRAFDIDQRCFGPDHPTLATDLNNLAGLLHATNRLDEAEPLMRRQLVIFADFGRNTGHTHPHFQAAINNYSLLLRAMGKTDAEIEAAIKSALGGAPPSS